MTKIITSSSNSIELKFIILLGILYYEKSKNGSSLSKVNYFFYIIKHRFDCKINKNNFIIPFEIEKDLKMIIRLAEINDMIIHIKDKNQKSIRYSLTSKGSEYIDNIEKKSLFSEILDNCKKLQKKIPQTKIDNYLMVWK
ncbi:hypothetical protein L4D04_02620 [Photobacterium angustum]|uniref:Uncharacterized protein n=1 Tax=Photobacterium angustum (strain S14 / CCUG 15956) TaxID=314292 RepID=Q1ZPA0_PHOAS|nr:hypothetical protein [Photobacterium angustum]EAS64060.1 hypothetical protein VAS14_17441 [Photobacterium angustum S14]